MGFDFVVAATNQVNTNLFKLPDIPGFESDNRLAHIVIIIALAIIVHFLVQLVRFITDWLIRRSAAKKNAMGFVMHQPKFITVTGLISSGLTFVIYFFAVGFVLTELKVDLTAYIGIASVIGIAVGFGLQGLVQDIVTGITLILTDTINVGDIIDAFGQVGRVEKIGLRFIVFTNFFNQEVFVPNRMIANFGRYPEGGIRTYADVQIPLGAERQKAAEIVKRLAKGMWTQFPAIILSEPTVSEIQNAEPTARDYMRVEFKIWSGQGPLIETTFKMRCVDALKPIEPAYADWMVVVTYRSIQTDPSI